MSNQPPRAVFLNELKMRGMLAQYELLRKYWHI
jgi:hypothetical protein